jgi:hypothetical protein
MNWTPGRVRIRNLLVALAPWVFNRWFTCSVRFSDALPLVPDRLGVAAPRPPKTLNPGSLCTFVSTEHSGGDRHLSR